MGGVRLGPWPVRAYCPGCGGLCSHATLAVGTDGTRWLRCKSCGHEWTRERGAPRTAATSEAERRARQKPKAQREPRTCIVCGMGFVPASDTQVTCSMGCYERARYGHGAAGLLLLASRAQALDRRLREVAP